MRFKISFQCEKAQFRFDSANPEVIYCFNGKAFKQRAILEKAKKYGNGVLRVVNGNNILETICF